ncbi:MAG TPA: 50S ribosomal protein L25, partial [Mycobacterium sp.]|nr:50S ribosomal protein L25 [Mycobacterium sp.]
MATIEFEAQRRTLLGKKVKQLRRAGRLPGVVYGPVVPETVPVTVDSRQFAKFYQRSGHSTLFVLRWEDGNESVFIRDVQTDPLSRQPVHVDFFAPNLRKPVRAMVPLVFHNPVQASEGVLTEARTELEVEALPASIPHQLDVDVSGLERPGDLIRVGDLTMPAGVTAVTDANELIAQIESVYVAPTAEEGAAEAEAAE